MNASFSALNPHQIAQLLAVGAQHSPVRGGEVWLVGAGPGDVELLTLKALRVIQSADVVVYDRLVSAPVMAMIPADVLCIDVGKTPGNHRLAQEEINQLLVELALSGQRVVRLKGGDPFIFGRGGEEMQHCQQHHVPCHIVPGITAAMGCAAASGIPLTHRSLAQSVRFITGHGAQGEPDVDWASLAAENQTLVFYMGLASSTIISQRLIQHGMAASTALAIIERGTQPEQRVITGALGTLTMLVERHNIETPALLIIGAVVGLYQTEAVKTQRPDAEQLPVFVSNNGRS